MSDEATFRILVVDDSAATRILTERFLQAITPHVLTADSGQKALEICRRESPDLVLLDVVMPEMDGYEVCAELQKDPATQYIPVIFLTALDEEQDRARAFSVGAVDYLVKPVQKEKLLATVQTHLETKSRWYSVQSAVELWDEASLPEKFIQFREMLIFRLRPSAENAAKLRELRGKEVYRFTEFLELTDAELAQHMAEFFSLQYVSAIRSDQIMLGVLPTSFCRSNQVVAVRAEDGGPAAIITNPFAWGLEQLDTLDRAFKHQEYRLQIAAAKTINSLFIQEAAQAEIQELGLPTGAITIDSYDSSAVSSLLTATDQVSAVDIVNGLIADAIHKGASDLHLEPARHIVRVRYRIDGKMRSILPIQRSLLSNLVARIKVMSGMDPAEMRKPQDGGCLVLVEGRHTELRVSTLPGIHGEVVVMRILNRTAGIQRLEDIGFGPEMLASFRSLLAARQGMLLITGPTGSGKTTTLYGSLSYLNTDEVNIITVEDPVESDLDGINQIQVHERAGRTFANALRAILRQDPDIIMVGEIRDAETAEIACRSALTGHLVLSTLHTQHSFGTLTRLLDIGIPPYLIASALNGILAQRLVRQVCSRCAEAYDPPPSLRLALEAEFGDLSQARFRRGRGCNHCNRTGTRGRLGIFELLVVDEDLRRLISEGVMPSRLREFAQERGFRSLERDAFEKACAGLVPPEEVADLGFRVARFLAERGD